VSAPLKVCEYSESEHASAWDELVRRSRSAHFLFERSYMDYHADRFTDCSLVVFDGEQRLLAVLPANRSGDIVVSHAGLTFGGLIADASLTTRRTVAVLSAIVSHLRERGARELIYKPVPHIYHAVPNEEDLYALHTLSARLVRRDVSCAIRPDAAPPPSKGRRAGVAAAARDGVSVERSGEFGAFMQLDADALMARHGQAPVHSPEEMELLAGRFPGRIELHVARRRRELLAGVLTYVTDTVAHAQYIAASPAGFEAHALDAVVARLIGEVYREKRFFDFGISTEQDGRLLNEGLIRNKESFGARAVVYDRYALDCSSSA
jgi:hypothetical protein